MKIDLHVHVETQQFGSALELPKGCGIESATQTIDGSLGELRELLLELFKADTEGRKPNFETLRTK